jgi:hypothetical protein
MPPARSRVTGFPDSSRKVGYSVTLGPEPPQHSIATAHLALCGSEFQFSQRLFVGSAQDSALGDDGGDVLRWRHVEGWVFDADSVWGELFSGVVGDLDGGALLDGDVVSVGGGEIDGGPGGGDVEGDAVFPGEDGDVIGADLVGDVSVGGDAVGADDDGLDLALAHEAGGHVVAEHGGGDAVVHQLPRSETRALEEGAGFVGVDVDIVAALDGGADDAEGAAVAAGGECSGIAVSEHGAGFGHEARAVRAHGAAGGDVFVIHAAGFGDEAGADAVETFAFRLERVVVAAHAVNSPEEIDGGGAGRGEGLGDDLEVGVESGNRGGGALLDADGDAHGSADADGGRSANDHGGDDVGDIVIGGCEDVDFFQRQAGLVEKADAFGGPFEGGNHRS